MAKQKTITTTWAPTIFKRYVFFDSLNNDRPALAKSVKSYFNKRLSPDKNNNPDYYDRYIQYIQTYIQNLEALANSEREKELQYVKSLTKLGMPIDDYYTGTHFDYIKFIRALNLVHTDLNKLKSIVQTNKANISTIQDTLKQIQEESSKSKLDEAGKNAYEQLVDNYLFAYGEYRTMLNDLIGSQLQSSFTDEVNKKLQQIFSEISRNEDFINQLIKILQTLDPKANIVDAIQNWCVEYIRQELINHQQDIKSVIFNPNNIDDNKIKQIFSNSLTVNYNATMTTTKSTIETIIDSSLNRGENLANILREANDNSLDKLLDVINASDDSKNMIKNAFEQMQTKIAATQKNGEENGVELEKIKRSVAAIKGNFTRHLNKIISEHLAQAKKGLSKEERNKIINSLMQNYIKQLEANIDTVAQYVGHKLSITSTSSSSVAEILASPDFEGWLKDNVKNLFIPGKEIQYKTDLTFNFNSNRLSSSNLKSVWQPDGDTSYDLEEVKAIAENKGKLFLQRYAELSKGNTSIENAEQAYRETLQKAMRYKRALLSEVDESSQKMINDYFRNSLDGSISVKEYHFYNNEYGYHMGSMGGSGKVIDAVPNILKMLELGGITGLDAEVIIQALLNSFEGSLLGTKLLSDIKSLLIGGAAMMLFDDGFANAEAYLKKMQEELQVKSKDELPTGGSLHLLYLNNVYIPQSYVLFSVIADLKQMYADIISKPSNKTITYESTKNSLELNNPMSKEILKEYQENPLYPTSASKWAGVSEYAQQNVTIHFLFMGGMLDIMERLEKSFNPQV